MIDKRFNYIDAIESLYPRLPTGNISDTGYDEISNSDLVYYVENPQDYDSIEWRCERLPKPSKQSLDDEIQNLNAAHKLIEYRYKRASEYPAIGDQLDALWKGGEAAAEMLAKVNAVKNKYPKPQGN